jgi:hypothetical protein
VLVIRLIPVSYKSLYHYKAAISGDTSLSPHPEWLTILLEVAGQTNPCET